MAEMDFTGLQAYEEVSPAVVNGLKLLRDLDDYDTYWDFILKGLRRDLAESLPLLADGYNRYHYDDKAEAYREARSRLSRSQSCFLILKDVGVLNTNDVSPICEGLEGGIGRLNGLISRMEDDG
ncbi:hypothetical protein DU504_06695 [Haloplanus salinus]|uniref:Four helix bundle protein n=1 Tax=Haloplanus salinus TaxID=1126245 RepID=A0A368NCI5_9EURY|nr:hypothetical protein [Haloplanus salinus]RCU47019.1 hypothetical protein DU504_06695 [Haloplanus salinus]